MIVGRSIAGRNVLATRDAGETTLLQRLFAVAVLMITLTYRL